MEQFQRRSYRTLHFDFLKYEHNKEVTITRVDNKIFIQIPFINKGTFLFHRECHVDLLEFTEVMYITGQRPSSSSCYKFFTT